MAAPKKILAKFYVAEIVKYATSAGRSNHGYAPPVPYGQVTLRAVTRKKDDNEQWASATPSGEIKMTVNGPAFPEFEAMMADGDDILVTLERAPKPPEDSATV